MKRLIYSWIHRKQDALKRSTDRRFEGLWMGTAPELLLGQELLAGDVLFCGQAKRDKVTELIQNTTDGVYVHCGIYIGDGTVVDAVRSGVREIALEDFVSDYSYVSVTRCPGSNQQRSELIVEFARTCARSGLRYNHIGAALAPLREYFNIRKQYSLNRKKHRRTYGGRNQADPSQKKYFCSEFVVQCYIECGYIAEEEDYYQTAFWTPTGLAEENIFQLVGFMSNTGLTTVDPKDPHLNGCSWVLTPEGREHLEVRRKKQEAYIKKIQLETEGELKLESSKVRSEVPTISPK
jgi:hypothetical protein